MKKLLIIGLMLVFAFSLSYADKPAYTDGGYDEGNTGYIDVYAYMAGVEFSLSTTQIAFNGRGNSGLTPCDPDEGQHTDLTTNTPHFCIVQNDGGVNIDIEAYVNDEEATSTGPWSLVTSYTATPGTDLYELFVYMAAYDEVYSTGLGTPAAGNILTFTTAEINEYQNIVAFNPADYKSQMRELWFGIIAPASATNPGTSTIDDEHHFEVAIAAHLHD